MDITELSDAMHGPEGQLATGREIIPAEWTDYNGHMNVAYYVVAFDRATDAYKDQVGIDKGYRERTRHSTFAAELHVVYLQEVREGEEVYLTTYLLDWDAKRHHFIHSMWRASDNTLCATMEVMSLHINLEARKTAPWPSEISERLAAVHAEHQALPRPEQAGRKASLQRRG
ncbi:hypothetical protein GH722_12585 [Alphaproteobacteria bacterium HT1-32]|nr:hypothetical protein [Alphaproteobacteria bacterium HT1-32]